MNAKQSHHTMKEKIQPSADVKQDNENKADIPETSSVDTIPEDETAHRLEALASEVTHWKDMAMRTAAEMENLRKRLQIDMEKASRYANASFAKDLLPVADCLEQATVCAQKEINRKKENGEPDSSALENLLKGVEMTRQNLMNALHKQQIEKIESLGKVFDPNLHKVIQEVEDADKEEGTIVQELQPGYTIGGDRVLRDAMVVVSKK